MPERERTWLSDEVLKSRSGMPLDRLRVAIMASRADVVRAVMDPWTRLPADDDLARLLAATRSAAAGSEAVRIVVGRVLDLAGAETAPPAVLSRECLVHLARARHRWPDVRALVERAVDAERAWSVSKGMPADEAEVRAADHVVAFFLDLASAMGGHAGALDWICACMDEMDVAVTADVFNRHLSAAAERKDVGEAFATLAAIWGAGIEPTEPTYYSLAALCFRTGQEERAVGLVTRMAQDGLVPSRRMYRLMIGKLTARVPVDRQRAATVSRLLDDMARDGFHFTALEANASATVLAVQGRLDAALEEARRLGDAVTRPTYVALVRAALDAGQVEQAFVLYANMRSDGHEPNASVTGPLMEHLARAGNIERAMQVMDMVRKDCQVLDRRTLECIMAEALRAPVSPHAAAAAVQAIDEMAARGYTSRAFVAKSIRDQMAAIPDRDLAKALLVKYETARIKR